MWVREGNCPPERCQGRCCRHLAFWLDQVDTNWLETRGLIVKQVGGRYLVDIPQTCPHLTQDNLCDLYYQPARPKNCEDWPTDPSQTLLDDCGFSFRWADEPEGIQV